MDLASFAPADNAARDAHARPLIVGNVAGQSQNMRDRLMAVEASAPRVQAQLLDADQLVRTRGFEMVGLVSHGRVLCWKKSGRGIHGET